ncbi:MAG: hypothetical protein ACLU98_05275 [Desulfovibrio fairfieldensis]|jgi:hypothetical protein
MLLGIVVNNASEKMELAVDNETGHVKIRFTDKGAWSAWQRIDVKRKGNADNGELDEAVYEATTAKTAQTAKKLASPITISFSGDVSGTVSFDGGSEKATCNISGVTSAINAAMASHVERYHRSGVSNRE